MAHAGRAAGGTRGTVAVLVALVMAVSATACGGSAPAVDDSAAGQVRAMLRKRAALLADGDVAGYLAAVAPGAQEAERKLAEGAATVPLAYANVSFQPRPGARSTAAGFRDAEVQLVYRYDGLADDNQFRLDLSYDLERRDGSWIVTRSEVVEDEASRPPVWSTGPVALTRTDHFLALYRPGLPNVDEAMTAAERAWTGLGRRLDAVDLDPAHLVLLAADEQEYASFKGAPSSEGELAAAGSRPNSLARPESRHMLVKAARLVDQSAAAVGDGGESLPAHVVFQHELAHLALMRSGGPFLPSWVAEGAAMYLAGERRVEAWRAIHEAGVAGGMSLAPMFAGGVDYPYANAATLHLIEEFGAERFFDFYAGFRPLRTSPEFLSDPVGMVLGSHYDLTLDELDQRTRAYIERAAGAG